MRERHTALAKSAAGLVLETRTAVVVATLAAVGHVGCFGRVRRAVEEFGKNCLGSKQRQDLALIRLANLGSIGVTNAGGVAD